MFNINTKLLFTEDLDEVYKLAELCGQSITDIKYTVDTAKDFKIVGLFDSTTLVGYGIIEVYTIRDKSMSLYKYEVDDKLLENSAILIGCSIHPSYRGMNLQKQLIKAREDYAKQVGCENILVTVGESSVSSQVNLTQSGYTVIGERMRNNGKLVYLMCKQ